MSLKVSITVICVDDSLSTPLLNRALRSAGIRAMDQRGPGIVRRPDSPGIAEIFVTVIADDERAITDAVVAALIEHGVNVLDSASQATLVEAHELGAQGAHYDIALGTLTIDTSGSEWGDLDIQLIRSEDSIIGLMASITNTRGRVEDGLPGLSRIIIRRPSGAFTEV